MPHPKSSPLKVLVTGGAGFIGTHLCRKLRSLGHEVCVLDLKAAGSPIAGVRYILGDARDPVLVRELMENSTTVYHLAATVSVPLCQHAPLESYSNNFQATLNVLEAVRVQNTQRTPQDPIRFVFASTAAIYGSQGDDRRALSELDTPLGFLSFYAAQKYASEQAMDQYHKAFGLPSLAFRFFNVFGPGQDPTSPYSGVITVFSKLAVQGKPLPLNAGGIQTRDFISVHDIVEGLVLGLKLPDSAWLAQPINLGSGKAITIRELAEAIKEVAGTGSFIVEAPPREGDVLHSLSDISRARALLGFMPKRELKEGLRELQ